MVGAAVSYCLFRGRGLAFSAMRAKTSSVFVRAIRRVIS